MMEQLFYCENKLQKSENLRFSKGSRIISYRFPFTREPKNKQNISIKIIFNHYSLKETFDIVYSQ